MSSILTSEKVLTEMPWFIPQYKRYPTGQSDCFYTALFGFLRNYRYKTKPETSYHKRLLGGFALKDCEMKTFFALAKDLDFHPLAVFGLVSADEKFEEPMSRNFDDIMTRFLLVNDKGPLDLEKVLDEAGFEGDSFRQSAYLCYQADDISLEKFLNLSRILGLTPPGLASCFYCELKVPHDLAERLGITILL